VNGAQMSLCTLATRPIIVREYYVIDTDLERRARSDVEI
jgi:hypothetical protein